MRNKFDDIVQLFDEVESLVSGYWDFHFPTPSTVWSPATDVFVAGDEVFILVEVPGVARQDLRVAVTPVIVEVSGIRPTPEFFRRGTSFYELELPYGVFRKRVALPCRIDPQRTIVELEAGLLTLRLLRAGARRANSGRKGP